VGKIHHPRRGSLAFRPIARAKRIHPVLKTRPECNDLKVLDFAGYKVGMTHIRMIESRKNSVNYNKEISQAVTVLECPPINIVGIRTYIQNTYGTTTSQDIWSKDLAKDTKKKLNTDINSLKIDNTIKNITLIAHTNPKLTNTSQKKPHIFEIGIGGNTIDEKINFAKEKLNTQIEITEIFKEGDFIDTLGVTKGKGFQGAVKRYGVKTQPGSAEKCKRKAGNLGPFTPRKTRYTVPQAGGLGYNRRTELNKRILKISSDPNEINVSGGFKNYGPVKTTYILLKGSISGASKRIIRFRNQIRTQKYTYTEPTITYISKENKQ
jgi:large subunit ribosomal protein L3